MEIKWKKTLLISLGILVLIIGGTLGYAKMSNQSMFDLLPSTLKGIVSEAGEEITEEPYGKNFTLDKGNLIVNDTDIFLNYTKNNTKGTGWIYFDLNSKKLSNNIDFVFGIDKEGAKPLKVQKYEPHVVTEIRSLSCDNVTEIDSGRAVCYETFEIDKSNQTLLIYNRTYDTYDSKTETITWNVTHIEDWKNVGASISKEKVEFDGGDVWYSVKNVSVTLEQKNNYRVYFQVPYGSNGKYNFGIKSSSKSLNDSINDRDFYYIDPWYNDTYTEDFHVQSGRALIADGSGSTTIVAGTDYDAPSNTSLAFIRLTGSGHAGSGRTGDFSGQPERNWIIITNPENLATSITFSRGISATEDITAVWEIIEYTDVNDDKGNAWNVRHVETLTIITSATQVNSSTVTGIADDDDVVVFVSGVRVTQSTGRDDVEEVMWVSAWNSISNLATLDRGAVVQKTGGVSIAVVEFTGSNWNVQRVEHNYTAADTFQEIALTTPVSDINKTFIHALLNSPEDGAGAGRAGQEAYLFNTTHILGQVELVSPSPFGVFWVIENTQSDGTPMIVQRVDDSRAAGGGVNPELWNETINAVVSLNTTSIMGETGTAPSGTDSHYVMSGINMLNTTTVGLIRGSEAQILDYRFEVVEWPTVDAAADTPPQWLNNLTNSTVAGEFILHSVTWTDDIALSGYIFEFSNGTGVALANDSFVEFTGTINESNVTKVINTTVGSFITWRVYANDSANQLNSTDLFNYTTTSANSCSYSGSGNFNVLCSDNCNITSNIVGDGSNLILSGSGNFNVQANITNFQEVHKDNACFVIKSNDAQIELVN